jgi:inorganic pyrophosphatase
MVPLHRLPSRERSSGLINAVIDTPKGNRTKYKFDEKTGQFRLSKLLPLGAFFPYNFGFIPSTRGEDGDALDILILMDESVAIGTIVPARLIGVLKAEQKEGKGKALRNDRLIGVLKTKYNPSEFQSLKDVDKQCLDEIEHFFLSYNQMEGRMYKTLGRGEVKEAENILKKGEKYHVDTSQTKGKS